MTNQSISQIIKEHYSTLSTGQKKVAELILQNQGEAAILTAFQMGRKVGVSETTVIRLGYALGFKGYSDMQDIVRKDWLEKKNGKKDEVYTSASNVNEGNDVFRQIIQKEKSVLEQLFRQLNEEGLWKAVDRCIDSERVYIGGFGSSYGAAYWMYYALKQYRGNVYLSNPTGFFPEDICDLDEDSTVVLFSFPRFRKESLELAERVKKQGSFVIAITNRQLSPIGQLSDLTLTTEEEMDSGHHSIASVVSLVEMILVGIQHRDQDNISLRQTKLEQLYTNQGLFIE
ncbi:MurR/RpiR family transcriptional regulator [Bacillus sp. es.034]|uniref:MurR/RpiR family transcriptional regulator n=1 Tax=Bacillus sp. es.034 TaxID=1761763 RepID=UPI000BF64F58|nr:MurR/RpiR family transcriptional regulator [Bacillus sp. es.034]PFG06279.1 RpiR family transcriptional regulator [Bacillus sp. es.034]